MRAFDRFVANSGGDPELKTELIMERFSEEEPLEEDDDPAWEEAMRKIAESSPWLNPHYYG